MATDERVDAALRAVAQSHDNECSPTLRGLARRALGLGRCAERQDCLGRESCEFCVRKEASDGD